MWFTIEHEFDREPLNAVWGIDLGIRSLYVARLDGRELVLHHRVLTIHKQSRAAELAALRTWLDALLSDSHGPSLVAVEEPPLAGTRNVRTFLGLAQTSGVAAAAGGPTAILVPVSSWKLGTVGNGSASKDDVARWLSRRHPAHSQACAGDQNYIDATCIALYAQKLEAG